MKKLFVFLTLAGFLTLNAQTVIQPEEKPYIEVTGTAEKEIVPDIIYVSILLSDKVTGKDTYTIDDQESKLKAALNRLDIDLSNLTMADAGSSVITHKRKEKGVLQTKRLLLKLSTAAQVSAVFEALHDNDIKDAFIERVDHSKMDELRKEVRVLAIKAAKDKATYLLSAIGEVPGKPLVITESMPMMGRGNVLENVNYRSSSLDDDRMYDSPELNFKTIKISFSYYVKYEIK